MPFNKFALVGLTWTPANNFSFKCTCIVSLYRIYIGSIQCIPQVLLKATDKSSHWNQRREANEQYYLTKNNKLLILKQLITSGDFPRSYLQLERGMSPGSYWTGLPKEISIASCLPTAPSCCEHQLPLTSHLQTNIYTITNGSRLKSWWKASKRIHTYSLPN